MSLADGVADSNRAEAKRDGARRANRLACGAGERAEMHIAGRDVIPGVGDGNLGLLPVVVAEPHGPKHRPGTRSRMALSDVLRAATDERRTSRWRGARHAAATPAPDMYSSSARAIPSSSGNCGS